MQHELDPSPWDSPEAYAALSAEVEADVVRWEWTDGPRYVLRRAWFRRHNRSRGRRLIEEPAEKIGCVRYGFDAADRVVVSQQHGAEGDTLETFYRHTPDRTAGFRYAVGEDDPALVAVIHAHWNGERLAEYDLYSNSGPKSQRGGAHESELFTCTYRELYADDERGRLLGLRVLEMLSAGRARAVEYALEYDDVGRLHMIHEVIGDEAFVVYQRPARGQTLTALVESLRARLIEVVPQAIVDALEPGDEVYAAALVYDLRDENCLPPRLTLALTPAWEALRAAYGDAAKDFLWDPDVFTGFAELDGGPEIEGIPALELDGLDETLDDVSFLLNQQLAFLDRWSVARDALNDVAYKLNRMDWSDVDGLAPDFVLYAVDAEFEDIDDNFIFCVPPALVARFQEKDLF